MRLKPRPSKRASWLLTSVLAMLMAVFVLASLAYSSAFHVPMLQLSSPIDAHLPHHLDAARKELRDRGSISSNSSNSSAMPPQTAVLRGTKPQPTPPQLKFPFPEEKYRRLQRHPDRDTSQRCFFSGICDGDNSCGLDGLGCVTEAAARQSYIRNATSWSWMGYKRFAWGSDELMALGRRPNSWFGMGLTIVDSLDTLQLMGLKDEYQEGRDWVEENLHFDQGYGVSVFETTIRILGGLLSAFYHSDGDEMFLRKAEEFAISMMPAFNTSSGIPVGNVVPGTPVEYSYSYGGTNLAEAGTLSMEFTTISRLTGNGSYAEAAMLWWYNMAGANSTDGLFCESFSTDDMSCMRAFYSFGAAADSCYEYMLKQWVLSAGKDQVCLDLYNAAMGGLRRHLVRRTWNDDEELTFAGELESMQGGLNALLAAKEGMHRDSLQHLTCFLPGLLVLGHMNGRDTRLTPEDQEDDLTLAARLGRTCYEMYRISPSGIAPDTTTIQLRPKYNEQLLLPAKRALDIRHAQAQWSREGPAGNNAGVTADSGSGAQATDSGVVEDTEVVDQALAQPGGDGAGLVYPWETAGSAAARATRSAAYNNHQRARMAMRQADLAAEAAAAGVSSGKTINFGNTITPQPDRGTTRRGAGSAASRGDDAIRATPLEAAAGQPERDVAVSSHEAAVAVNSASQPYAELQRHRATALLRAADPAGERRGRVLLQEGAHEAVVDTQQPQWADSNREAGEETHHEARQPYAEAHGVDARQQPQEEQLLEQKQHEVAPQLRRQQQMQKQQHNAQQQQQRLSQEETRYTQAMNKQSADHDGRMLLPHQSTGDLARQYDSQEAQPLQRQPVQPVQQERTEFARPQQESSEALDLRVQAQRARLQALEQQLTDLQRQQDNLRGEAVQQWQWWQQQQQQQAVQQVPQPQPALQREEPQHDDEESALQAAQARARDADAHANIVADADGTGAATQAGAVVDNDAADRAAYGVGEAAFEQTSPLAKRKGRQRSPQVIRRPQEQAIAGREDIYGTLKSGGGAGQYGGVQFGGGSSELEAKYKSARIPVMQPLHRGNLLRPETVESLYYLYRATGDPTYREWGWNMFRAFEMWTRVDTGGYASAEDVMQVPPLLGDKMESFWIAETLKYFYLLFSDDPELVPLDQYVFNTEAHPLPIWGSPKDRAIMEKLQRHREERTTVVV